MPNWCTNDLDVTGNGVAQFLKDCKGYRPRYKKHDFELRKQTVADDPFEPLEEADFTMNALVPVPAEVCNEGYSSAGYHWQSNHWGTKWDINWESIDTYLDGEVINFYSEIDNYTHAEQLIMSYETAWGPNTEWVEKVSKLYPHLQFKLSFSETGQMFAGIVVWENGDIVSQRIAQGDTPEYWEMTGFDREDFIDEEDEDE